MAKDDKKEKKDKIMPPKKTGDHIKIVPKKTSKKGKDTI